MGRIRVTHPIMLVFLGITIILECFFIHFYFYGGVHVILAKIYLSLSAALGIFLGTYCLIKYREEMISFLLSGISLLLGTALLCIFALEAALSATT
ncbi:hypothetical protein [Peribacillus kribbensis]|uniref:hypothetical protein n=1 Tax=Peribacillus kribbensis TaxID=356658 RepID=UPI000409C896|nr:hypothetical protein [Peribacillus kribbensis]